MEKFLEGHRKEERCKKEEKERVKKLQVERQQSLQQQEEKEKAVASSLSYDGEEKEGMRDATTGKFVARDGREEGVVLGEGNVEHDIMKHARGGEEDEEEDDLPSAKKQKFDDEENEDVTE